MTHSEPIAKILIVDDEPQIRRFVRVALQANNYDCIEAENAEQAITHAALYKPDMIILDLGLPDKDGKEVISQVRSWGDMPIIVLSVRSKEEEKIQALDLGADDYITKPFGIGELMARIRNSFRRQIRSRDVEPEFRTGDLLVDLVRRKVSLKGEEVHLSKKEYHILTLLVQHAGLVLTHQHILREVWGDNYSEDTAYLRVFIRQLRSKIEPIPTSPVYIVTEAGVGYRLEVVE